MNKYQEAFDRAKIERDFYNLIISTIINNQKNKNQPIYVIATYWCGTFKGIETYTTKGDEDLEKIKKVFRSNYAWKNNEFGVTEQTHKLIKIDFTEILDFKGNEVENNGTTLSKDKVNYDTKLTLETKLV